MIGDRTMGTMRSGRRTLVVLAFLVVLGAASARAADEDLKQKALKLNDVTGMESIKGQILALVENKAESKKLLTVASGMAKEKPQPFALNATLILASVAENLKEVDISEQFYRLHAKQSLKLLSGQGLTQAYAGLIQLFYDNKQYAKSEEVCREFLGIEGEESVERLKPVVLRRLILAMAKQGAFDKATDILDRLIKDNPENWLNLDLKARLLHEADKTEDAVKVYLEVIDKVKNDNRLTKDEQDDYVNDYLYALSSLYIDLNQVDKAAEALKTLLAKKPDDPTYNNDLGYIWADHDMNLAESEKLIRKALEEDRKQRRKANPDLKPEQDKDSAAYLDSLGWVLFKQKKYKEAKGYLQQAVEDETGRHLEIYDHLGDVYLALGEKAEAVAAWKKGLQASGTSKRDQKRKVEVEKKLKAHE
jgi:tetratricopeptide (TPR) repeat protein